MYGCPKAAFPEIRHDLLRRYLLEAVRVPRFSRGKGEDGRDDADEGYVFHDCILRLAHRHFQKVRGRVKV